jgi:hypothetical protein
VLLGGYVCPPSPKTQQASRELIASGLPAAYFPAFDLESWCQEWFQCTGTAYWHAVQAARSARFERGESPFISPHPLPTNTSPPRFGEYPAWTSNVIVEELVLATTLEPCPACGCTLWGQKDGQLMCDQCGIVTPAQPYTVLGDAAAWMRYHVAEDMERTRYARLYPRSR